MRLEERATCSSSRDWGCADTVGNRSCHYQREASVSAVSAQGQTSFSNSEVAAPQASCRGRPDGKIGTAAIRPLAPPTRPCRRRRQLSPSNWSEFGGLRPSLTIAIWYGGGSSSITGMPDRVIDISPPPRPRPSLVDLVRRQADRPRIELVVSAVRHAGPEACAHAAPRRLGGRVGDAPCGGASL